MSRRGQDAIDGYRAPPVAFQRLPGHSGRGGAVKVAVLGLGSAGRRHAGVLLELGHQVIAFDPYASSPPSGVSMMSSPEEAIATGDAVIVASPNAFHAEQACMAMEEGRPVLIEKPL